jgi:hypothetical protein
VWPVLMRSMPSKARKLAALVVEAPNTLMDLRMLPIWEVP